MPYLFEKTEWIAVKPEDNEYHSYDDHSYVFITQKVGLEVKSINNSLRIAPLHKGMSTLLHVKHLETYLIGVSLDDDKNALKILKVQVPLLTTQR